MPDQNNIIHLTESQLRHVVETTVEETLLKMGVDVEDPMEMQRDFKHLREWRQTTATLRKGGLMAGASIIVSGVLGLIWVGVKANFGQ